MDERLRFVAKLLDGEKMAVMCREFGIRGLEDRARSPYRHPNRTPLQVETAILRIKP